MDRNLQFLVSRRHTDTFPWATLLILIVTCFLPAIGWCQFHESFESVEPSWSLRETDCVGPRKTWTQRRANDPVANNRVEQIYFNTGPGTKVLVAHKIPPAFIIPELTGSIRLHGVRPGIQVLLRVVLPHTPAPDGPGPMTTMLHRSRLPKTPDVGKKSRLPSQGNWWQNSGKKSGCCVENLAGR